MNPHHFVDPREPFEDGNCRVCDGEGFLLVTGTGTFSWTRCVVRCEACGAFDTDESARRYVEEATHGR